MVYYLFVTGGVVSSLGKGVIASSLGSLLQEHGIGIRLCKIDPYLNLNTCHMNPEQHGEVYVTSDGIQADLDLGHYYRFTSIRPNKNSILTTGMINLHLMEKENSGEFNGQTIQLVPHFVNVIQDFVLQYEKHLTNETVIVICEVGGTTGDIEGKVYLEAIRQLLNRLKEKGIVLHVTLVPFLKCSGELKTKPTQHSVQQLQYSGLQPTVLVCRSDRLIPDTKLDKIALFCNVSRDNIVTAIDTDNIHKIPTYLRKQRLDTNILKLFGLPAIKKPSNKWDTLCKDIDNINKNSSANIKVVIVAKYSHDLDSYLSLVEAVKHASYHYKTKVDIQWVRADLLESKDSQSIKIFLSSSAVIIPGGFGKRGFYGKIFAAHLARINKIPILGICFGLHAMVIEFARNVANIKNATSAEIDDVGAPVISPILESWSTANNYIRPEMRLGAQTTIIKKPSLAYNIYRHLQIQEHHRHRYEVNPSYAPILQEHGMVFSGHAKEDHLVEIIEIEDSDSYLLGVQFHPEYISTPFHPHPIFINLLQAATQFKTKTIPASKT